MARFIPPLRVTSGRSAAERRVLQWLSRLDDQWTILHSLGVLNHPFKRWAEADALILGPPGLIVLEVKGGRVARRGGVWEFTDRFGRTTRSSESPADQAGGAHGAIRRLLLEDAHLHRSLCSGWALAFPDVTMDHTLRDVISAVVIDASSAWSDPADVLGRWCRYWASRTRCAAGLSPHDIGAVVDALRGDLDLRPSLSLLARDVDAELTRATLEQERVLHAFVDNPRLAVAGRAGTGKTMLALSEARRLAAQGRNVLLTCGSAPLARRLTTASGQLPTLEVLTYDAARRTARPAQRRYDDVIVDEAQDLGARWRDLVDTLASGGVHGGNWRLFYDPAQDLTGGSDELPATLPTSVARARLTLNCRNTRQIAVMASMLTRTELDLEAPVLGPDVTTHWWEDQEAHDLIVADAVRESAQPLPGGGIAILTATPMPDIRLSQLERRSGVRLTRLDAAQADGVVAATIEEFKGLEAAAVIVGDVNSLDRGRDRRNAYVACTRARTHLTLMLHASVRPSYDACAEWFGAMLTGRATAPAALPQL